MRSSVIVPIFQSASVLTLFLESLRSTMESDTQLILVNDGSPGADIGELIDDHARRIKADHGGAVTVATIHNKNPRGCGQALNQGLELADGDHVFFVDSDLILEPGWQDGMLRTLARHPEAGMTAGVLLYPQTGGVQHCGIAFGDTLGRHLNLNADPATLPDTAYPVQLAAFALFAMTREVRDTVGALDERYYNGYEDFDYQMRAARHGFRVMIDPAVTCYHWERRNGAHRAGNRKTNLARFWRRWGAQVENDLTPRLTAALRDRDIDPGGHVLLDMAETRGDANDFWAALADSASIERHQVRDYSTRVTGGESIPLPLVVPAELIAEPRPLLLLVENFVRLLDNRMWLERRAATGQRDVVVDLYGNVLALADLRANCWPGVKVR